MNDRQLMSQVVWQGLQDSQLYGILGRKNSDGSYDLFTAQNGVLYVTLTVDGGQTVTQALNVGVQPLLGLPVTLQRDGNLLVIVGADWRGGRLSAFAGSAAIPGTGRHNHKRGSGNEFVWEMALLEAGRISWSGTANTVTVGPFYYLHAGEEKYFPGGNLSLTPYLPSTSGKWAWSLVGVDPRTNTLVAVTGAEYDAQTDLTAVRVADIEFGLYEPCGAVQVQEGDTALNDWRRYVDAHRWFNERERLDDLVNVHITNPAQGHILYYDSAYYDGYTYGAWLNGPAGATFYLDDLADVVITSPVDGAVLEYDTADGLWKDAGPKAELLHAPQHQDGGADEVATATPAGDAIPKADVLGKLDAGWIPDLSGTYQPLDADLTSIAALTGITDRMLYATGTSTWALATLTAFIRTLLDDAAASDARTTLGLGSIATAAAAAYLLLAGQAGGQTGNGGTGSGDSLTLHGSAHATKGPVLLNPTSGGAGIGTASPLSGSALHLVGANNPVLLMERSVAGLTGSILAALSVMATTSGDMANGFGPAIVGHINDSGVSGLNTIGTIAFRRSNGSDTTGDIVFLPSAAGVSTERLRLLYDGKLGHGVDAPTLFEFSHDGTSGRCFGTVNITDGTAQTVIANGALDVKDVLYYEVILDPSTGSSAYVSGNTTPTGTTITLFDSGGSEVLVLHCNADGSVDLQRTAGTRTYVCTVRLLWQ